MKKLPCFSDGVERQKGKSFITVNTILLKIRLQDLSGEDYYTEDDLKDLTDYLFT